MNRLLISLFLTTFAWIAPCKAETAAKPNIIFILADDLGYGDLACYNPDTELATPHIDSLAAKGVRFTQFYAASNVCAPSRRAILTGRYPSRLGEWAEAYETTPVDNVINAKDEPCFPLFLKQAGYVNGMFGKWNIGSVKGVSTPDAQGFDTWLGSHHNASHFTHHNKGGKLDFWENGKPAPQYRGQFADDVFVDKSIAFIKENREKPFFVYLSLFTPHAPFQDPADPNEEGRPDLAAYNIPGAKSLGPPNPADRPVLRKMTEHVDRRIGDLLKTLSDLGLEQNTLVIFTSDNGGERACINHPLTGFKQQMVEGGIRVPTMVKWPAVIPAGKVSHQPGIAMDLTRTILAAAGAEPHIPKSRELDGIDLTPVLTGKSEPTERALFWRRREWSQTENAVWAESCIKGDWKYLREFRQAAGFARTQQGTFHAEGYLERLFNLKDDIAEQTNLADQHPEKIAAMRREFEQWRAETVERHRHYQIPVADQYGTRPFTHLTSFNPDKPTDEESDPAFSIPPVFSSNMILQRDVPVPVWGKAENGTVVTISWNGKTQTSTAHDGTWRVMLPPMPASAEPRVMSIKATGQKEIRFDNVVVGDVWLASGQSNMTMRLSTVNGGPEAIAASQNPLIRHYAVPRPGDAAKGPPPAWQEATPKTTPHQSAVGYFFVHELQQKLGIPVGLLHCSYGGTVTETWCSPEVMARPWPQWEAWHDEVRDKPDVPERNKNASFLYERMIQTVMPFPVKGFLWYQGEGNAGRALEQRELFPAMVADRRKSWGDDKLPFFFVQLARHEAANWHPFRQAQFDSWRRIPYSHMAVTIDLSKEPGDHPIHPKTKAPIGHRLALAARALVYGEKDLVYSGPVIRSMETKGNTAILSFDHLGESLASLDSKPLRGFFLSADGSKFLPGTATIVGNTVRVTSPDIASPIAVRYGAEDDMGKETLDVNLANTDGLPASPFTISAPKSF